MLRQQTGHTALARNLIVLDAAIPLQASDVLAVTELACELSEDVPPSKQVLNQLCKNSLSYKIRVGH